MTDLEHRLAEVGRALERVDGSVPPIKPVLDEARRGKWRRRIVIGGATLAALAVVGAIVGVRDRSTDTRVTSTPANPTTSVVTTSVVTTSTSPVATTTTTLSPSGVTTTTASSSGTVRTTQPAGDAAISNGVWVVGLDGTGLHRVSIDSGPMSWSPDGQRLAVAVSDTIWLLSVDQPSRATTLPVEAQWARCLDWSSRGELAWATADGALRVSDDERGSREIATGLGEAKACRWSPDGSMIAVGGQSLAVFSRSGQVLGRRPAQTTALGTPSVSWSPDGARIAALEARDDGHQYLVIVEPEGDWSESAASQTPDTLGTGYVSWSPAGSSVYLQTGSGKASRLYRVDVTTRAAVLLEGACCRFVDQLPEGRFVGFAPVDGVTQKAVVVADEDLRATTELARARSPRPDAPPSSECAGAYFTEQRLAPNKLAVAFTASTSYGPRCDSPSL